MMGLGVVPGSPEDLEVKVLKNPICASATFPWLCNLAYTIDTQLGLGLYKSPYDTLSMPPVVGTPVNTMQAPTGGEDAAQTIQGLTNQQMSDWQTQTQGFFSDLNAKLQSATGMSWWEVVLIGVGVVGLISVIGKGPARYGR